MYQVVYNFNGERKYRNYDKAEYVRKDLGWLKHLDENLVIYHTSVPQKPSIVPLPEMSGYSRSIKEGWVEVESSRISNKDFTVYFERLSTKTIDVFCDALNGWYNEYTKWAVTYVAGKTKVKITGKDINEADKIFTNVIETMKETSDSTRLLMWLEWYFKSEFARRDFANR